MGEGWCIFKCIWGEEGVESIEVLKLNLEMSGQNHHI